MSPTDPPQALRRDARRNRDVLIATARTAFAATEDAVPLERIAATAGVGIGTLYRHFPTREALAEAVYAAELDDLTASVESLLDDFSPDTALRHWVDRYAQFVATKRGMMDALRAGWASGRITTPATRERVTGAIRTLLDAGAEAGNLRADVEADDVTALLLGVLVSRGPDSGPDQVGRLLDLVVDSVRTVPPGPGSA